MPHLWPTGSSSGCAPIDYGPVLLRMPFGFHLTMDTLPSGAIASGGFRSALAVSGFRLRARLGFSIPSISLRPARHYPRFWIRRSSSERRRDFNPPEQCAAQRTLRVAPSRFTSPGRSTPGSLGFRSNSVQYCRSRSRTRYALFSNSRLYPHTPFLFHSRPFTTAKSDTFVAEQLLELSLRRNSGPICAHYARHCYCSSAWSVDHLRAIDDFKGLSMEHQIINNSTSAEMPAQKARSQRIEQIASVVRPTLLYNSRS